MNRIVACAAVLLAVGGCQADSVQRISVQAGDLAGRTLLGPAGRGLGQTLGFEIGGELARALRPAERERATDTTKRVLRDDARPGTRERWTSPERPNTGGSSEVVRVTEGGNCRVVREIAIVDGKEIVQEGQLCRGQDGGWTRAA